MGGIWEQSCPPGIMYQKLGVIRVLCAFPAVCKALSGKHRLAFGPAFGPASGVASETVYCWHQDSRLGQRLNRV